MGFEKKFLNSTAFLSGCMPISLIYFFVNYYHTDMIVIYFARIFIIITFLSGIVFYFVLRKYYTRNSEQVKISSIKRKDIFSSGAISYYVLPFISFVTNGKDSVIILSILIVFFLKIFNNNMMFLYTPLIDILGYKILECDIELNSEIIRSNIIVRDITNLAFTGITTVKICKIDEGIFAAKF